MLRPPFAILALFSLLTIAANVQAVDKGKLRRAVSLPSVRFVQGFGFNTRTGFSLDRNNTPLPEQIVALRKSLKHDPTNAEAYCRLGDLYTKTKQGDEAKAAYTKAEELCQRQLGRHPDDMAWRLTLADVLQGRQQNDKAEALLRQAVKDAPENWRCWLGLAECLGMKSLRPIMGNKPFDYNSPDTLLQAMRTARPTPERIAASQPYQKEAVVCFDRALALAPRESKIYWRRVAFRQAQRAIDAGIRMYRREKVDYAEVSLPSADMLEDLRRIADLCSDDYVTIGAFIMLKIRMDVRQYQLRNRGKSPGEALDMLSEATEKRLREDLTRLEKGMRNPDKHKAARAAEILGILQSAVLEDSRDAEKSFRRSIELDPAREGAWDMLAGIMAHEQRYPEALELCRARLVHIDSGHNRLLLSKAYENLDQLDRAEVTVKMGLRHDPDDFMLNLALADLLLMQGDSDALTRAGEILGKLANDRRPAAAWENRRANYVFACGICGGLIGKVKQAREMLEQVQKRQPKYPRIKEALEALDEPDKPVSPRPQP